MHTYLMFWAAVLVKAEWMTLIGNLHATSYYLLCPSDSWIDSIEGGVAHDWLIPTLTQVTVTCSDGQSLGSRCGTEKLSPSSISNQYGMDQVYWETNSNGWVYTLKFMYLGNYLGTFFGNPTASQQCPAGQRITGVRTYCGSVMDGIQFFCSSPVVPVPSTMPSWKPTEAPTQIPTMTPSKIPSSEPTKFPSTIPPSKIPSSKPTEVTTQFPTMTPSKIPSSEPTEFPSRILTVTPSKIPSSKPTEVTTQYPTMTPSKIPSSEPNSDPFYNASEPTDSPTGIPTLMIPSKKPSAKLTKPPTSPLSGSPTSVPSPLITVESSVIFGIKGKNQFLLFTVLLSVLFISLCGAKFWQRRIRKRKQILEIMNFAETTGSTKSETLPEFGDEIPIGTMLSSSL